MERRRDDRRRERRAVTQSRPPVDARAGVAGIARGDRARHARSSERDEQAALPTRPNIVVAEQWLCFLLGFICMACGGWGIFMKYSLDLSSGYVSWLGSAYGPILRFTAVACLVSGAVLLRRGLTRPDMSSVSGSRNVCDLPAGTAYAMQREHSFDGRVEALGGSEKKGT
jgi:hypothetical protein